MSLTNKSQLEAVIEPEYPPMEPVDLDTLIFQTCSICLSNPTKSVLIPCYHSFCFPCIRKWLISNPVCPLCKQETKLISNNSEILEVKDLKYKPSKWGKGPMSGLALRRYIYKYKKKTIVNKTDIIVKPELKEWISRDLEAIGIQSELLVNYIYQCFIQFKSDPNKEAELNRLLQDYLAEYTELFVGELIRFSCSRLNIKNFDSYIKHE
ncbi:hypothetical protein HDV06_005338 [Boothiomyces sp. JEL0866]|nr:hypothetical protein HDV06_005338 [Boothiomyces sp. JEL0866]